MDLVFQAYTARRIIPETPIRVHVTEPGPAWRFEWPKFQRVGKHPNFRAMSEAGAHQQGCAGFVEETVVHDAVGAEDDVRDGWQLAEQNDVRNHYYANSGARQLRCGGAAFVAGASFGNVGEGDIFTGMDDRVRDGGAVGVGGDADFPVREEPREFLANCGRRSGDVFVKKSEPARKCFRRI